MIDDEDDGKELWFKMNKSRTCSLMYVEYSCGERELYILDDRKGSTLTNPTEKELEEKVRWLESKP